MKTYPALGQNADTVCMKTKYHYVKPELDTNTLVFNSRPTSVAWYECISRIVLCGGLDSPLCFVRCVVMPDLVDFTANHSVSLLNLRCAKDTEEVKSWDDNSGWRNSIDLLPRPLGGTISMVLCCLWRRQVWASFGFCTCVYLQLLHP